MRLKIYERTGIKEETNLKERQEDINQKKNSEQEIRHSIERGLYKENCQDKYNLDLMNYFKEYKKTENLLMLCYERSLRYEENICILIEGYIEYFNTYGNHMTAFGLRGFRKKVESVINLAYNVEKKKKREAQIENALIDFVIECYDEIEYLGNEISIPGIIYLMFDLDLDIENLQEYEEVKNKVKTIYEELKND